MKNVLFFIAGALIGAGASALYFQKKYEKLADDEIQSVKERFSKADASADDVEPRSEPAVETKPQEAVFENYQTIANRYGCSKTEPKTNSVSTNATPIDRPYVISPDEYGSVGYHTEELSYYTNGYITDSSDTIVDNIDDILGDDWMNRFGEYDYDPYSVYVRNDALESDYAITKEVVAYNDAL